MGGLQCAESAGGDVGKLLLRDEEGRAERAKRGGKIAGQSPGAVVIEVGQQAKGPRTIASGIAFLNAAQAPHDGAKKRPENGRIFLSQLVQRLARDGEQFGRT